MFGAAPALRDDYNCFYPWLHATWAPSQSMAVAKNRQAAVLVPGEQQQGRCTRVAAVCAHTHFNGAHVAADQGATIGSTYRCFGLAARCDPVMRWMDGCVWSVVGGFASRVDLLEGRLWAAGWSCLVCGGRQATRAERLGIGQRGYKCSALGLATLRPRARRRAERLAGLVADSSCSS